MEDTRFFKFIRKFLRPITNFLWPVKIINANKFVEGKGIYICNHYSMLDPVPFVTDLFENNFNALMKAQFASKPILGKLLLKVGTIPVHRDEPDMRAIKKCMDVLRNNEPLVIFPEGTRNRTGSRELLEFKDGVAMFALKTKAPIIPMVYNKPIKTFRKTYLLIGNPMNLEEYYGQNLKEVRGVVTDNMKLCMQNMQKELDEMLKDKKALKQLLKSQKAEVKQIKKQNKLEYKKKLALEEPKAQTKETEEEQNKD